MRLEPAKKSKRGKVPTDDEMRSAVVRTTFAVMVDSEDITPNKCDDFSATKCCAASSTLPKEAIGNAKRERMAELMVATGRAHLDELIRAEGCDDDQEFLRIALRVLSEQLGARCAVAVLRLPFESGSSVVVPYQLDVSLAGAFLSDPAGKCDDAVEGVPMLVPLADDPGITGTLLCRLLEQSGITASLAYPLRRNDGEVIGWARFLFERSVIPKEMAIVAGRYLLCRMMLTLDRIWLMRHAESTSAQLRAVFNGALDAMLLVQATRSPLAPAGEAVIARHAWRPNS